MFNKELVEELHKTIVRKLKKTKSIFVFYRQYSGCCSCWYTIYSEI